METISKELVEARLQIANLQDENAKLKATYQYIALMSDIDLSEDNENDNRGHEETV